MARRKFKPKPPEQTGTASLEPGVGVEKLAPAFATIIASIPAPISIMIGEIRLLVPERRFTPTQLRYVERAWVAQGAGRTVGVEVSVDHIERLAWPAWFNPHREWPLVPPQPPAPKPKLGDPVIVSKEDERGRLNKNERKELETAEARLERATSKEARVAARKELARIEGRVKQRVTVASRSEAQESTLAMAEARGEEVERPAHGAAVITSRDGLKRQLNLGNLTEAQYAAGLAYRKGYEQRSGDLQASGITEGGAGHSNNDFVAARYERAMATQFVATVDRQVAMGCIKTPVALQMLKWVAGEGRSLTDWGKGSAREKNIEALQMALDITTRVLKDLRGRAATS